MIRLCVHFVASPLVTALDAMPGSTPRNGVRPACTLRVVNSTIKIRQDLDNHEAGIPSRLTNVAVQGRLTIAQKCQVPRMLAAGSIQDSESCSISFAQSI
jgi:hypothetical protein